MWGKVLSHPMTILGLLYAGCVLTAIWAAIVNRFSNQQPAARNHARLTFHSRRRLNRLTLGSSRLGSLANDDANR